MDQSFEADRVRILVLGGPNVGKTILCRSLEQRAVTKDYSPTMRGGQYRASISAGEALDTPVVLIDSVGWGSDFEMFDMDGRRQQILDAQAFIVMYSTTSMESFELVDEIHEELLDLKKPSPGQSTVMFALVGTKNDLADDREVLQRDGTQLANEYDCPFFELTLLRDGLSEAEGVAMRKRIVDSIAKALLQDMRLLSALETEGDLPTEEVKKAKRKTSTRRDKRKSKKQPKKPRKAKGDSGLRHSEPEVRNTRGPMEPVSPRRGAVDELAASQQLPPTPIELAKTESKTKKKNRRKAVRRQRQLVISQVFTTSPPGKVGWQVGGADPRRPPAKASRKQQSGFGTWGTRSIRRLASAEDVTAVDAAIQDAKKKKRLSRRRSGRKGKYDDTVSKSLAKSRPCVPVPQTVSLDSILRSTDDDHIMPQPPTSTSAKIAKTQVSTPELIPSSTTPPNVVEIVAGEVDSIGDSTGTGGGFSCEKSAASGLTSHRRSHSFDCTDFLKGSATKTSLEFSYPTTTTETWGNSVEFLPGEHKPPPPSGVSAVEIARRDQPSTTLSELKTGRLERSNAAVGEHVQVVIADNEVLISVKPPKRQSDADPLEAGSIVDTDCEVGSEATSVDAETEADKLAKTLAALGAWKEELEIKQRMEERAAQSMVRKPRARGGGNSPRAGGATSSISTSLEVDRVSSLTTDQVHTLLDTDTELPFPCISGADVLLEAATGTRYPTDGNFETSSSPVAPGISCADKAVLVATVGPLADAHVHSGSTTKSPAIAPTDEVNLGTTIEKTKSNSTSPETAAPVPSFSLPPSEQFGDLALVDRHPGTGCGREAAFTFASSFSAPSDCTREGDGEHTVPTGKGRPGGASRGTTVGNSSPTGAARFPMTSAAALESSDASIEPRIESTSAPPAVEEPSVAEAGLSSASTRTDADVETPLENPALSECASELANERHERQRKVDLLLRRVEERKKKRLALRKDKPDAKPRASVQDNLASVGLGSLGSLVKQMESIVSVYDADGTPKPQQVVWSPGEEYTESLTNMYVYKPRRASILISVADVRRANIHADLSDSSADESTDDDEEFSSSESEEVDEVPVSCRRKALTVPSGRVGHAWLSTRHLRPEGSTAAASAGRRIFLGSSREKVASTPLGI